MNEHAFNCVGDISNFHFQVIVLCSGSKTLYVDVESGYLAPSILMLRWKQWFVEGLDLESFVGVWVCVCRWIYCQSVHSPLLFLMFPSFTVPHSHSSLTCCHSAPVPAVYSLSLSPTLHLCLSFFPLLPPSSAPYCSSWFKAPQPQNPNYCNRILQ